MKIIVLGSGLVGGPMAVDLAQDSQFDVTVADINREALKKLDHIPGLKTVETDLAGKGTVKNLVQDFDFVLSAVPGFMGFQTLREVIEAKKNVVDIAFFPEDPFLLDELARQNDVTAIVDCGVAPGMSNILAGYVDRCLDATHRLIIYVGGLPEVREWPFEYKAVFSPIDVIEEYVRPARYVENGKMVTRPALSEPELIFFPGVGTLEAFVTDGLRTLARTMSAPDMKEKTLRYPGHIEKMAMLRETGFFSREEIQVGGMRIQPLDVTAKLLFPKWKMNGGDRDMTVMKLIVEGEKAGKTWRHTYDLLDHYDTSTGTHSMARTTGYAATLALRMMAQGLYYNKGISAPEFIGRQPECVDFMLQGLKERGIIYRETIEKIDGWTAAQTG
jgi:saccharopine dehydrogenase-like NADP-dependent oxidoreductase